MNKIKKIIAVFFAVLLLLNICFVNNTKAASTNYNGQAIVLHSKMFLGLPYVEKGETTDGFDCSGFVKYVYAHFGVNLPRTTYEQVKVGTKISKENLKPGDIVFFGTENNVYHDGIYIGGGRFIHSPKSGDVVRIEYLKYMEFYTGVRIAQN